MRTEYAKGGTVVKGGLSQLAKMFEKVTNPLGKQSVDPLSYAIALRQAAELERVGQMYGLKEGALTQLYADPKLRARVTADQAPLQNPSRRKFMKDTGAMAARAALPKPPPGWVDQVMQSLSSTEPSMTPVSDQLLKSLFAAVNKSADEYDTPRYWYLLGGTRDVNRIVEENLPQWKRRAIEDPKFSPHDELANAAFNVWDDRIIRKLLGNKLALLPPEEAQTFNDRAKGLLRDFRDAQRNEDADPVEYVLETDGIDQALSEVDRLFRPLDGQMDYDNEKWVRYPPEEYARMLEEWRQSLSDGEPLPDVKIGESPDQNSPFEQWVRSLKENQ